MKLGEQLVVLRKENKLSQERLAEKVGVTRQTISNWELGETSPNPEQLKALSQIFQVSIDELLNNDQKTVLVEKISNTEKTSRDYHQNIKSNWYFITYLLSVSHSWFLLVQYCI